MLDNVSIIIPLAPNENKHKDLLPILQETNAEIITVSEGSRAKSMNIGAMSATRPFFWFLHADSKIKAKNIEDLEKSISKKPNHLHYFGLSFDNDGPAISALNAWGANIRSKIFCLPYGDQALCIAKKHFRAVGRYDENLLYGEDLMFVWKLRRHGIKLNNAGSKIKTSARAYSTHGWLKLTLLYQKTWIKMSVPQAYKLIMRK